jgi:hypothetical protein
MNNNKRKEIDSTMLTPRQRKKARLDLLERVLAVGDIDQDEKELFDDEVVDRARLHADQLISLSEYLIQLMGMVYAADEKEALRIEKERYDGESQQERRLRSKKETSWAVLSQQDGEDVQHYAQRCLLKDSSCFYSQHPHSLSMCVMRRLLGTSKVTLCDMCVDVHVSSTSPALFRECPWV